MSKRSREFATSEILGKVQKRASGKISCEAKEKISGLLDASLNLEDFQKPAIQLAKYLLGLSVKNDLEIKQ